MDWQIKFNSVVTKDFRKLDKPIQKRIRKFLLEKIAPSHDPRDYGEPLAENLSGKWRWRVGDYRIIADIFEKEIVVEVVKIGHRSNVYKG